MKSYKKRCDMHFRHVIPPRVVEMSDINYEFPDYLFHTYHHSSCSELFHRSLKEQLGIEAVASFAYGNIKKYPQIILKLWVKDSEVTDTILKNTPYKSVVSTGEPLYCSIVECFINALHEDNNPSEKKVSELWEKQKASAACGESQIYVGIDVFSYLRCYIDALMGRTADAVGQAFKKNFASYERLECYSLSLNGGPIAHNHLYLFLSPQEKENAIVSGDAEKMRMMAYEIISVYDIFDLLPFERYNPQIESRRALTSEQIYHISRG